MDRQGGDADTDEDRAVLDQFARIGDIGEKGKNGGERGETGEERPLVPAGEKIFLGRALASGEIEPDAEDGGGVGRHHKPIGAAESPGERGHGEDTKSCRRRLRSVSWAAMKYPFGLLFLLAPLLGAAILRAATDPALKAITPYDDPSYHAPPDVPGLPRVLLLGDSISIGYTLPVRERLRGIANVHRPAENCGPTKLGLAHLDQWIGSGHWDLIHFNFGLHDLKYIDDQGNIAVAAQRPPARDRAGIRKQFASPGRAIEADRGRPGLCHHDAGAFAGWGFGSRTTSAAIMRRP